jgi:hypothetical protein
MPASLVGAAAQARLLGGGGLVANFDAQLVALADGRIVSNHSGSILSNHGSNLISDQGGGAVAPRQWRLLLGEAKGISAEGQIEMWGMLSALDLIDQAIQGALLAKPVVGQWSRFRCPQMALLPLPPGAEALGAIVGPLTAKLQAMELAALATQGPEGLRLRLAITGAEGSPLAESRPFLDLRSEPQGGALAFARFPPVLEELFGMAQARLRLSWGPDRWSLDTGEDFLPLAQRGFVAQQLNGVNGTYLQIRRRWQFGKQGSPRDWLQVFQSSPDRQRHRP